MKASKIILFSFVLLAMVLVFSVQAHAGLTNLGTDSIGNRLIYDTDLDITWYDYTKSASKWQNQVNWADALSVSFGINTYTDWRLPVTNHCFGYYCSGSEMWHLYNAELHNSAGGPLTNIGDFQDLQPANYWSGTNYAANSNYAWLIDFNSGRQSQGNKGSLNLYALAVMDGMAVAPEPVSSTLFIIGGATLGFRRFRNRGTK